MRTDARQKFGKNIRQLRRSKGLSQETLAERCELSVDAIRRIEWGAISPSLSTLGKLAAGLDLSLRTLFDTFERERRDEVAELCDFLATRSRREVLLATRLVRALFEVSK